MIPEMFAAGCIGDTHGLEQTRTLPCRSHIQPITPASSSLLATALIACGISGRPRHGRRFSQEDWKGVRSKFAREFHVVRCSGLASIIGATPIWATAPGATITKLARASGTCHRKGGRSGVCGYKARAVGASEPAFSRSSLFFAFFASFAVKGCCLRRRPQPS
jgi:hypothetical protein